MSAHRIVDDLTYARMSRQRKYQIRMHRRGLCSKCGQKAVGTTIYCAAHAAYRGIKQPGKNRRRASKGIR
jgi:hypothetical protein